MFPISPAFQQILDTRVGRNRLIIWGGTITLVNGVTYDITPDIIDTRSSGSISHKCELPFIGGAYCAEFQIGLFLNIDPRLLKNAIITMSVRLVSMIRVNTWDDAASFSWYDLSSVKWGDMIKEIHCDIPMGVFLVTEAKRSVNTINIKAYDYMIKFNTDLPKMDAKARLPFDWLRMLCSRCNVELGMTSTEVRSFVNGTRSFTYADVGSGIKTCRDLLSHMATVLGAIAGMDRYGRLVLSTFKSTADVEINPDNRFSSLYDDNRYYYTGITAQYKAQAVQEYYHNVRTAFDDGLIVDIGTNVYLQISNNSNRATAIQAIIDAFKNLQYTPFEATIPFHPEYDLLDVISFTGGHAPTNCIAPITSITRPISGAMTMKCDTPKEQENPVRETTPTSGVSGAGSGSGSFYASSDFWIEIASFPDAATSIGDDTVTTEVTVDCTVDHTAVQIAWTGAYTLDEAAKVMVKVMVDSDVIYQISDNQTAGDHVFNVTTGHQIDVKGKHSVRVLLSETPLPGNSTSDDNGGEAISAPVEPTVGEVGEIELTP